MPDSWLFLDSLVARSDHVIQTCDPSKGLLENRFYLDHGRETYEERLMRRASFFLFSAFEHNCLRTIFGAQDDTVKDNSQHASLMKHVKTLGLGTHAKLLVVYLTLCNPMDCSLTVSSVHGIL